jgi:hypothetical protein
MIEGFHSFCQIAPASPQCEGVSKPLCQKQGKTATCTFILNMRVLKGSKKYDAIKMRKNNVTFPMLASYFKGYIKVHSPIKSF